MEQLKDTGVKPFTSNQSQRNCFNIHRAIHRIIHVTGDYKLCIEKLPLGFEVTVKRPSGARKASVNRMTAKTGNVTPEVWLELF